jgi:hypothetical protein
VAFVVSLVAAASARAGGQFVDLAVGGGRVWLVGEQGVDALDADTGRVLATPTLVGAAYPLSVVLAGGAAWVGSVENGYVWGTLSRVDVRTARVRVVWRKEATSVQYVAAGAGSVWALIGAGRHMELARFATTGRLLRLWQLPRDAGRMAADDSGCWISSNRWLLHIDPSGRLHRALRTSFGDVATGGGAVWLAQTSSVLRVDEGSGAVRRIDTGRLQLGGFQHDLAVSGNSLYLLQHSYTGKNNSTLVRVDVRTGRTTRSEKVPGIADAVVVTGRAVWVATNASDIYRYDERTLRWTLFARLP